MNRPCACLDDDPGVCWADRYNLGMVNHAIVEEDGGPCDCYCHHIEFDVDEEDHE